MSDHLNKTRNERRDFIKGKLEEVSHENPMLLFQEFYQDAHENSCADPHAMVLGTVSTEGQPSSRIVYMRDLIEEGIIFYTNYDSFKGSQIDGNNKVSLLFYWDCIERQVRIEGVATKVPEEVSDAYFASRPRLSQIGAWASSQSQLIASREELEGMVEHYEKKFPNEVPRPPHWGGFLVEPHYFEFWQGRLGRLHDRICFTKEEENWKQYRIAP